MKKFFTAVIVSVLLLCTVTVGAGAAVTKGDFGQGLKWSYDTAGCKLTIYGNGRMDEWYYQKPWEAYEDSIKSIEIQDGVEYISSESFKYYDSLEKIDVSTDNPYYCSQNGVLYNKNMSSILFYPAAKSDKQFNVSADVKYISCDFGEAIEKIVVDPENPVYSSDESGVLFHRNNNSLAVYPGGKTDKTYTVPDDITMIESNAFKTNQTLEKIVIPANITHIEKAALSSASLKCIEVDADNETYSDADGVLFNKDQTSLLCYPSKKEGLCYYVPDSVDTIEESAFGVVSLLKYLIIGDQVESIRSDFEYMFLLWGEIHFEGSRERWDEISKNSFDDLSKNSQLKLICNSYPNEEELQKEYKEEYNKSYMKVMAPVYALKAAIIVIPVVTVVIVIICVKKKKKKLKAAQQNTTPTDSAE